MAERFFPKSITFDVETEQKLNILSEKSGRTASGLVRWLVNQEFARMRADELAMTPIIHAQDEPEPCTIDDREE